MVFWFWNINELKRNKLYFWYIKLIFKTKICIFWSLDPFKINSDEPIDVKIHVILTPKPKDNNLSSISHSIEAIALKPLPWRPSREAKALKP